MGAMLWLSLHFVLMVREEGAGGLCCVFLLLKYTREKESGISICKLTSCVSVVKIHKREQKRNIHLQADSVMQ